MMYSVQGSMYGKMWGNTTGPASAVNADEPLTGHLQSPGARL